MIALRSLLTGVNLSLCLFSCYAFQPLPLSSTNGRSKMFSRRNEEQRLKNGIIGNDDDSGNNNEIDIVDTRIERRSFVESTLLASSSLVAASLLSPVIAFAEDEETTSTSIMSSSSSSSSSSGDSDELIDVYFGCGCFWHVQHEMVEAERKLLGRDDKMLTSRAGYAGGNLGMKDGKVCYHNLAMVSDYGKLGHAEIVSIRIPSSKFKDFAIEYCKLFKDGMRPDQGGDRGLEYRNVVGFKGGAKNKDLAAQLVDASKEVGDQLDFAVGKGSDKDIATVVWIMDNTKYPAFVGEQYHQFHDGFNFGENYPNSYNSLAEQYHKAGEDFGKCPRV